MENALWPVVSDKAVLRAAFVFAVAKRHLGKFLDYGISKLESGLQE